MTDDELDRQLRSVNLPVMPRPEFTASLWALLEAELTAPTSDVRVVDSLGVARSTSRPTREPRSWRRSAIATALVAALIAILGIVAIVRHADHHVTIVPPSTTIADSSSGRFLPAALPSGLHQESKTGVSSAPSRMIATLAPTIGRGFVTVVAGGGSLSDPDFGQAVDVNGASGFLVTVPGLTYVVWDNGNTTYAVLDYGGASDGQLISIARSLRSGTTGDEQVDAPTGWMVLPHVTQTVPAGRIHYVGDTIGEAVAFIWSDGIELVDQLATHVPGATTVGEGDQAVITYDLGTESNLYRKLDATHYVWVSAVDLDEAILLELIRSVGAVSQQTWDANTNETVHDLPYTPDPAGYTPTITAGPVTLDSQPGPAGSICLRVTHATDTPDGTCLTHADATGSGATTVTGIDNVARAIYGTSTRAPTTITATLTDGSQVDATLAAIPGGDLTAWIIALPDGAVLHDIDAVDATSHTLWHIGPTT